MSSPALPGNGGSKPGIEPETLVFQGLCRSVSRILIGRLKGVTVKTVDGQSLPVFFTEIGQ